MQIWNVVSLYFFYLLLFSILRQASKRLEGGHRTAFFIMGPQVAADRSCVERMAHVPLIPQD